MFIKRKSILILLLSSAVIALSCKKQVNPVNNKIEEKTSENHYSKMDISVLDSLLNVSESEKNENFEKRWTGTDVSWKDVDGKMVISSLKISKSAKLPENFILNLDSKTKFEMLDSLTISSDALSKLMITDDSSISYIDVNASMLVDSISIKGEGALKTLKLSDLSSLASVRVNAGEMEALVLQSLPKLSELSVGGILAKEMNEFKQYDVIKNNTIERVEFSGDLSSLEYIYLHSKSIKVLNLDTKGLSKLSTLTLSDNKIQGELRLMDLPALENVSLRGNSLSSVHISDCNKLSRLDISSNKELRTFEFSNLESLKSLSMDEVSMESLNLSGLKALKNLSAYSSGIRELVLTDSEGNGPELQEVALYDNKLQNFVYPASITSKMSILNLRDNEIESVDISAMYETLENLNLNNNRVSELIISEEYGRMENFDEFELENNSIPLHTLYDLYDHCNMPNISKFRCAPQIFLNHQNIEAKTVDCSEYQSDLGIDYDIVVVKWNETENRWDIVPETEYSTEDYIVNLSSVGKGKYRVGLTASVNIFPPSVYENFSPQKPYILGEFDIE